MRPVDDNHFEMNIKDMVFHLQSVYQASGAPEDKWIKFEKDADGEWVVRLSNLWLQRPCKDGEGGLSSTVEYDNKYFLAELYSPQCSNCPVTKKSEMSEGYQESRGTIMNKE